MKIFAIVSTAMVLLGASSAIATETPDVDYFASNSADFDFNEVYVEHIRDDGGGLQAPCNPNKRRSGCKLGYFCEPIIGDPNRKGQCIPGSAPSPPAPVGEDCAGQRMPSCRGDNRIAMCCPPSRRGAMKGEGKYYRCVNSGGGMQAQCTEEDELDFLEVDTAPSALDEVFAEHIRDDGGELQAPCNPKKRRSGCKLGYFCEPIVGDPNRKGQCIPGSAPVGEDCAGQRMPSCRGDNRIAMCCSPSRRGARHGKGKSFRCVNSGGGVEAQCPEEYKLHFSEVGTY